MDYATEFTNDRKTLYNINVMRRYKGAYLPVDYHVNSWDSVEIKKQKRYKKFMKEIL